LESHLEELKKKGHWALAREILEFLEKEHPEELEKSCVSEEICELFWKTKGILKENIQSPEILLRITQAELTACRQLASQSEPTDLIFRLLGSAGQKREESGGINLLSTQTLHELKYEKDCRTLVNEILEFVRKEYPEDYPGDLRGHFSYGNIARHLDEFWRKYGVFDSFRIKDRALADKITETNNLAIEEESKIAEELIKTCGGPMEIIEWIANTPPRKIVEKFEEFLKRRAKEDSILWWPSLGFWSAWERFWEEMGVVDIIESDLRYINPRTSPAYQRSEELAKATFSKFLEKRKVEEEKELLRSLTKKVVDWLQKNHAPASRAQIDLFLVEEKILLPPNLAKTRFLPKLYQSVQNEEFQREA